MRGLLACFGVLAIAWAAAIGTARADAVAPPPDRCPTGSVAVDFCHGPPTCRAHTCEMDADCGAGMVCRDARLCTTEYCCSGRCCGGGCGVEPTIYTHVFGPCDASGGCSDFGAACTMQKVCVPGGNTDAGGSGTDAGAIDAGRTEDAGDGSMDAGRREDAGGTAIDAGRRRDAGSTGGPTDGGCCSVVAERSAAGGGLFLAALAFTIARVARRRAR